jgi:enoyl-CoA hydratase/carnithine racemase
MDEPLLVEQTEHVVTLTLNRPDRLNALNRELIGALGAAWERIDADPSVRAVIVTGAGRAFCSGADVEGLSARQQAAGEKPVNPRFTARHKRVFKPVITAVNGVCAGAALHFVADCEIVLASERATFVDTHVNVGQVSALEPIGLSRRIPLGAVLRMVVLGKHERMTAAQARELGLVSEVVPEAELLPRARELAALVATASPTTVQKSLEVIWHSLEVGLEDAYDHGFDVLSQHWSHPDAAEGPRAFMEKRDPEWTE